MRRQAGIGSDAPTTVSPAVDDSAPGTYVVTTGAESSSKVTIDGTDATIVAGQLDGGTLVTTTEATRQEEVAVIAGTVPDSGTFKITATTGSDDWTAEIRRSGGNVQVQTPNTAGWTGVNYDTLKDKVIINFGSGTIENEDTGDSNSLSSDVTFAGTLSDEASYEVQTNAPREVYGAVEILAKGSNKASGSLTTADPTYWNAAFEVTQQTSDTTYTDVISFEPDTDHVLVGDFSGDVNFIPEINAVEWGRTFSSASENPSEPLNVGGNGKFKVDANDRDGAINNVEFNFRGTTVASGGSKRGSHSPNIPGEHTLEVVITDDTGATRSATTQVQVNDRPNDPTTSDQQINKGESTQLTASASDDPDGHLSQYGGDRVDYLEWYDANGNNDWTKGPVSVSPNSDTTYKVRAVDIHGATSGTSSVTVTVNRPPSVSIRGPSRAETGDSVSFNTNTFDPDSSGRELSYSWSFNNGDSDAGSTGRTRYSSSGTYTVTVTVTDEGGLTDTDTKTITIGEAPSVSINGPNTAKTGDSVSFNADVSDRDSSGRDLSYSWSLGNGDTAAGSTAGTTYSSRGTYTVTVTVTDELGFRDTASKNIAISEPTPPPNEPPKPDINADASEIAGLVGHDFDATGTTDPDDDIADLTFTYKVQKWDGSQYTTIETHEEKGKDEWAMNNSDMAQFKVVLTVDDGTTERTTSATYGDTPSQQPPSADITGPDEVKDDEPATFDGSDSNDPDPDGSIVSYDWSVQGESISGSGKEMPVDANSLNTGDYTVELTVEDNDGGTDKTTHSFRVVNGGGDDDGGGGGEAGNAGLYRLRVTGQETLNFGDSRYDTPSWGGQVCIYKPYDDDCSIGLLTNGYDLTDISWYVLTASGDRIPLTPVNDRYSSQAVPKFENVPIEGYGIQGNTRIIAEVKHEGETYSATKSVGFDESDGVNFVTNIDSEASSISLLSSTKVSASVTGAEFSGGSESDEVVYKITEPGPNRWTETVRTADPVTTTADKDDVFATRGLNTINWPTTIDFDVSASLYRPDDPSIGVDPDDATPIASASDKVTIDVTGCVGDATYETDASGSVSCEQNEDQSQRNDSGQDNENSCDETEAFRGSCGNNGNDNSNDDSNTSGNGSNGYFQ